MDRNVKVATAVAVVLAAAVAFYGLFLALIGISVTLVQEYTPFGGIGGENKTIQYTTPHALLGTLAAAMIIVGLLIRKMKVAWIGLTTLFAYSTVFLFSIGILLLPVAAVLLILLKIIHSSQKVPLTFWRDPEFYGSLGFVLIAGNSILYFFTSTPMTSLLYLVIGATAAAWGCYRNILLAWLGSILVLALSISLTFNAGLLPFIGAIVLLTGAIFKTFK
jgi:hypothetical protein